MSRRKELTLRTIVEVRGLQRLSAEADARRAGRALKDAQSARDEAASALKASQACWDSSVARAPFSLMEVLAWGGAVAAGQAEFELACSAVTNLEQEAETAAAAWRCATGREDEAEALRVKEHRRNQHLLDEARAADIAIIAAFRSAACG